MENKKTNNPAKVDYEAKLKALTEEYEKKLASLEEKTFVKARSPKITDISKNTGEDYVEVRLFKDGDRYRDDVLVGINGYMCRIKRGVPVKIKRKFAELISNAEENTAACNANFLMHDGKMERFF